MLTVVTPDVGDASPDSRPVTPKIQYEATFCPETQDPYAMVEWRVTDAVLKDADQNIIFEQKDVEAPIGWSDRAVRIVAQKYFRGRLGTPQRERSVREIVGRVVDTIHDWLIAQEYFAAAEDVRRYCRDLTYLLLTQRGAFNSPVWFNLGVPDEPQQCSACFIQAVDDDMQSIAQLQMDETMVFKMGSGSGSNLSKLRSSKEHLRGGGTASGPVSFMRGFDSWAGVIKSGGKCLAPDQKVFTVEYGPIEVSKLSGTTFHVLSFDPPTGQVRVKPATAWKESKQKRIARIETDKGSFRLSEDHPVKSATGEFVAAARLSEGFPLFASKIDLAGGYVRVGLRDGKKGRDHLHRMVARDILKRDIRGKIVHHEDEDRLNNSPKNLKVLSGQSEHASKRGHRTVDQGTCTFVNRRFPKPGSRNGMHRSSTFWKDDARVAAYRAEKTQEILKRNPENLQTLAARSRMLNTAWRVLVNGASIETFEDYYQGRVETIGRIAYGRPTLLRMIESRFGTYEAFREEVAANNHRVRRVILEAVSDVYNVEVLCETVDDKSPESGHNFMLCDFDGFVGSGLFVSNTRRAAKMVILNADHPDILEFVDSKVLEERKAHALIAAGFSADFADPQGAYASAAFQNANHSVRVTDEFMEQVELAQENPDTEVMWDLIGVTTGEVLSRVPVLELWKRICDATWFCGDPGLQFDTTINDWHTCPTDGRINGSNPCSEFMSLDDSACNLASLNLMKFRREDGTFDQKNFCRAASIFIIAQEAMVDKAHYPTQRIRENTHRFRPLGLGYANLGAYLMSVGMPYDSDEGRRTVAEITSMMAAQAYVTSGVLAAVKGPFAGYNQNRAAMLRVIDKHREAAAELGLESLCIWDKAAETGEEYGFRNAQTTLLAPTGTIGFLMDCDTTGVEPESSLYKVKKLVGGGSMEMENRIVEMALNNLGYTPLKQVKALQWLGEHQCFDECPVLASKHLSVFDCAIPSKGSRILSVAAHLKMTAAVQPFLSGAISKTMNVPNNATPQALGEAFFEAWRLGLKAVALYRDGCKKSQPLETAKTEAKARKQPRAARRRLKDHQTNAHRIKFRFGDVKGYLIVTPYEDTGMPGEIFVEWAKEGSTVSGLVDGWAQAISYCLQYGVPLAALVRKYSHTKFEPSGFSEDSDIRFAHSIYDALMRKLAAVFLDKPVPSENLQEAIEDAASAPMFQSAPVGALDNPMCTTCGSITVSSGANCYKCDVCGSASGCG